MIRIMLICPNPNDATAYYRAIAPFARLQKDHPELAVYTCQELDFDRNWSTLAMADIVFLQRPYHETHLKQAEAVRRAGIPLWVDFDDDQFHLAFENPAYDVFMNERSWDAVRKICAMADVVTVSTPALKDVYGSFNQNTVVIRNGVDDRVFGERPAPERTKTVIWRGAGGHERDLDSVSDALVSISHDPEFADWTFHFVGHRPWQLLHRMRDSHTHWSEGLPFMEYMEKLWQTRAAIAIIPLVDDAFNRAKSNIAALESFYSGAVPLTPHVLPEFNLPGAWEYGARGDFETSLRCMLTSADSMPAYAEAGWRHVKKFCSLTLMNEKRYEIIKNLLAAPAGIRWEKM